MNKLYVLDTNILIYDPKALFNFMEHDICLPITVIEELDGLKKERGQTGHNAREASRLLDQILKSGSMDVDVDFGFEDDIDHVDDTQENSSIEDGPFQYFSLGAALGKLAFFTRNIEFSFKYLQSSPDNYIIGVTRTLQRENMDRQVILVSKDINLRVKATAFGIEVQDYKSDKIDGALNIGLMQEISTDASVIDCLYTVKTGGIGWELVTTEKPVENACCIVRDHSGSKSMLARFSKGVFNPVKPIDPKEFYHIKPRNSEQRFLADVLLDPSIDMVVCAGVAGSGKTLLTITAGLLMVEQAAYDRVLITKAIQAVGNDIGFTPGTKEEKMSEWLKPFYDNLEYVMRNRHKRSVDQILEQSIEVEAMTYMRGRSLMNRFVVIDECQNLTGSEIKTIVSRVANTSKLVLLGDLEQIDNPILSVNNNGLAKCMARLQGHPNVAILNLRRSERGRVAKLAIENL